MKATDAIRSAFQPVNDPLGEALQSLRMSGAFYCRSEFTEPWGLDLPAMDNCLMFHVVTSGQCWVEVKGAKRQRLQKGDFTLLPHGQGHVLRSASKAKAAPLFDLPRELRSERYEVLRHGGGGERTTMICGAVQFDHPAAKQVVSLLPKQVTIDSTQPENEWILSSIRFMIAEASSLRPGSDTVITRVSDILVIQAIRAWIENDPEARKGWLGALRDKQIGTAIALFHRDPMQPWTVASLAEAAGMSRSAFAAKFMSMVGESPILYTRKWRMQEAINWLRESSEPIGELAYQMGYQSEAAFNRAFKNFIGKTPGSFRRNVAL